MTRTFVPAKRGEVEVRPGMRPDEVPGVVRLLERGDDVVVVDTVPCLYQHITRTHICISKRRS